MERRRDVFQAIADPTRRHILGLVIDKPRTAGDIAIEFDSRRQTISRHLKILVECGLLRASKSGREIRYSLNAEAFKAIAEFVQPFRKLYDERAGTLEVLMQYYDSEQTGF